MKQKLVTLSQIYFSFDLKHLQSQPLLEYLCHWETETSLPILYLLDGCLYIIKIKFGQGLNLQAHHV